MKHAGTIKLEIKCPVGPKPGFQRMHALRRTGAKALNLTMQDLHGDAVAELRAIWEADQDALPDAAKWREKGKLRTALARNWNHLLKLERERRQSESDAEVVYAPINGTALAEETRDNIRTRFAGEHMKDLISLQGTFPSFGDSTSFYCGGRFCEISGKLSQAVLGRYESEAEARTAMTEARTAMAKTSDERRTFVRREYNKWALVAEDAAKLALPLWGTGKKVVEFVVRPAGGSHRAFWRRLVHHFVRRDEVCKAEAELKKIGWNEAEKQALRNLRATRKSEADKEKRKEIFTKIAALINAANKRVQSDKDPIEKKLYGLVKMGRVGVVYNERRRKWFATISFIEYKPDVAAKGQKAALNFGVNVFVQALAENGAEWHEDGDQILVKRIAAHMQRKSIQRSQRTFGPGSQNRGHKRRDLPLSKRKGDESNFVQTYIRQLASRIIKWCARHGVADLYIENLKGIREQFERDTKEQAHEEVKRRIHSWPFHDTATAIIYEGAQHNIRVHRKGARYVSQRCPDCEHTAPENVQAISVPGIPLLLKPVGPHRWVSGHKAGRDGVMYRRVKKTCRFECVDCGNRGGADFIACLNHLIDVGAQFKGGSPLA
ncbi:hypothetical protein LCGC14_1179360, partial [marine sediment metagenome]